MTKINTYFLLLILITGCSSSKKSLYSGGTFAERQLGVGLYSVTFHGDSSSSYAHVQKMLTIRCAEIALANKSKYFIIVKDREQWEGISHMGFTSYLNKVYTLTNVIQFVANPVPNTLNYDSVAILEEQHKKLIEE